MKDGKHVVLCVDDDPDFLESLTAILEGGTDYIVATAASAEEGLAKFDAVRPDLMLVDLMMEEVDSGTALVKDLRARGARIPIFLLSSVGNGVAQQVDFGALGLAGVLQKPMNPTTLLSTLKAKLG